jgi:hypothetical protein
MPRTDLPIVLNRLTAKELRNFFRRALREKDRHEARMLREELSRRGVRLSPIDYGQWTRL